MTPQIRRGSFRLAALALAATVFASTAGLAHHGWRWATGGNIDVTGLIESVRLGNPHGVVTLDVDGERWQIEVGQPWRNERAGLKDGDLAPGVELRVIGEPSADPADKRVKAERLFLGAREYVLYPERD
jgi:hypothetical protein